MEAPRIAPTNRIVIILAAAIILTGCLDSSSGNKSGSTGGTETLSVGTTMTVNGTAVSCALVKEKSEAGSIITLAPGTEHTLGGTTYKCYDPSGSWITMPDGTTPLKIGEQTYISSMLVRCRAQSGTTLIGTVFYVGPGGNFNGITCSQ